MDFDSPVFFCWVSAIFAVFYIICMFIRTYACVSFYFHHAIYVSLPICCRFAVVQITCLLKLLVVAGYALVYCYFVVGCLSWLHFDFFLCNFGFQYLMLLKCIKTKTVAFFMLLLVQLFFFDTVRSVFLKFVFIFGWDFTTLLKSA